MPLRYDFQSNICAYAVAYQYHLDASMRRIRVLIITEDGIGDRVDAVIRDVDLRGETVGLSILMSCVRMLVGIC